MIDLGLTLNSIRWWLWGYKKYVLIALALLVGGILLLM